MKVICKSNEFIAIPTERKSDCLYLLGQFLNKETCQVKMDKEELKEIVCTRYETDSKYSQTITVSAEFSSYSKRYIILDKNGNLMNVVDKEQFENEYAILKEGDE